jgi:hypothetical protein
MSPDLSTYCCSARVVSTSAFAALVYDNSATDTRHARVRSQWLYPNRRPGPLAQCQSVGHLGHSSSLTWR